jgi:hypothetical protein
MTYEHLIKRLKYSLVSGIFTWNEREVLTIQDKTWNKKHAGKVTGYIRHNGYKVINLEGREYTCSRLAWFYIYKKWPTLEIDHINCDKLDNRISNLREASRSENAINKTTQSNNTTGYKGVWKRKNLNSWVAEIGKDGKRIKLGSFASPQEAHQAYLRASKELHGKFAKI